MLKNVFPGINKEYWFLFEQKIFIFRDLREIPKNAINIDIILESMEKLSQFRVLLTTLNATKWLFLVRLP